MNPVTDNDQNQGILKDIFDMTTRVGAKTLLPTIPAAVAVTLSLMLFDSQEHIDLKAKHVGIVTGTIWSLAVIAYYRSSKRIEK